MCCIGLVSGRGHEWSSKFSAVLAKLGSKCSQNLVSDRLLMHIIYNSAFRKVVFCKMLFARKAYFVKVCAR